MRRYTVICEWTDYGNMDADEIVVYAEDAVKAVGKAKKRWRLKIGLAWPNCRLDRAYVLTQPA